MGNDGRWTGVNVLASEILRQQQPGELRDGRNVLQICGEPHKELQDGLNEA